jgi:hypothetical protein
VEALAVTEAVICALGRGRSARDGAIVLEGVFGVTLTIDTGGSVEVVPSLVRGVVVMWTPFCPRAARCTAISTPTMAS